LGWMKGSETTDRKPQNTAQPSSVVFGEKRVSVWEKSGERTAGAALLAEKLGNVLVFVLFFGRWGETHKMPFASVRRSTNQPSMMTTHGAKMQHPPRPYKTPRVMISWSGCSHVRICIVPRVESRWTGLTVVESAAPRVEATINSAPNHNENITFVGYLLQK
jgi:hypothetical protein